MNGKPIKAETPQQIYDYITSKGATFSGGYDGFVSDLLGNSEKTSSLYQELYNDPNIIVAESYDTFASSMALKKKDVTPKIQEEIPPKKKKVEEKFPKHEGPAFPEGFTFPSRDGILPSEETEIPPFEAEAEPVGVELPLEKLKEDIETPNVSISERSQQPETVIEYDAVGSKYAKDWEGRFTEVLTTPRAYEILEKETEFAQKKKVAKMERMEDFYEAEIKGLQEELYVAGHATPFSGKKYNEVKDRYNEAQKRYRDWAGEDDYRKLYDTFGDAVKGREEAVLEYLKKYEPETYDKIGSKFGRDDIASSFEEANRILRAPYDAELRGLSNEMNAISQDPRYDVYKSVLSQSESINKDAHALNNLAGQIEKMASRLDKDPSLSPYESEVIQEHNELVKELEADRKRLEGQEVVTEEEANAYNNKVRQYNTLAEKMNTIRESYEGRNEVTKRKIDEYNSRLNKYNTASENLRFRQDQLRGILDNEYFSEYFDQFNAIAGRMEYLNGMANSATGQAYIDQIKRGQENINKNRSVLENVTIRFGNEVVKLGENIYQFVPTFYKSLTHAVDPSREEEYNFEDKVTDWIGNQYTYTMEKELPNVVEDGKFNWESLLTEAVGALPQVFFIMATMKPGAATQFPNINRQSASLMKGLRNNAMDRVLPTTAAIYTSSYAEIYEEAKNIGAKGAEALLLTNMFTLVEVFSEMVFPEEKAFTGAARRKMMKEVIGEYNEKGYKSAIKKFVGGIKDGMAGEGMEEGFAAGGENLVKLFGSQFNEDIEYTALKWDEFLSQIAVGAAVGAPLGFIGKAGESKLVKDQALYYMAQNYDTSERYVSAMYDQAKATEIMDDVKAMQAQLGNLPKGLSEVKNAAILSLLVDAKEKQDFMDGIEDKNNPMVTIAKQEIKDIQTQIEDIIRNPDYEAEVNEEITKHMSEAKQEERAAYEKEDVAQILDITDEQLDTLLEDHLKDKEVEEKEIVGSRVMSFLNDIQEKAKRREMEPSDLVAEMLGVKEEPTKEPVKEPIKEEPTDAERDKSLTLRPTPFTERIQQSESYQDLPVEDRAIVQDRAETKVEGLKEVTDEAINAAVVEAAEEVAVMTAEEKKAQTEVIQPTKKEEPTDAIEEKRMPKEGEVITEEVVEPTKPAEEEVLKEPKFKSQATKKLEEGVDWLDKLDEQLTKHSKETLGANVPVVVAQGAVKTAKVALKAGKAASEVIDAAVENMRSSDWYKGLKTVKEKQAAEDQLTEMFGKGIAKPEPVKEPTKKAERVKTRVSPVRKEAVEGKEAPAEVKEKLKKKGVRYIQMNIEYTAQKAKETIKSYVENGEERELFKTVFNERNGLTPDARIFLAEETRVYVEKKLNSQDVTSKEKYDYYVDKAVDLRNLIADFYTRTGRVGNARKVYKEPFEKNQDTEITASINKDMNDAAIIELEVQFGIKKEDVNEAKSAIKDIVASEKKVSNQQQKARSAQQKKKPTKKAAAKKIADKIRSAKVKDTDSIFFDASIAIPIAAYNTALDVAALTIEGGGLLADAVESAVKELAKTGGKFYDKLTKAQKERLSNFIEQKIKDAYTTSDIQAELEEALERRKKPKRKTKMGAGQLLAQLEKMDEADAMDFLMENIPEMSMEQAKDFVGQLKDSKSQADEAQKTKYNNLIEAAKQRVETKNAIDSLLKKMGDLSDSQIKKFVAENINSFRSEGYLSDQKFFDSFARAFGVKGYTEADAKRIQELVDFTKEFQDTVSEYTKNPTRKNAVKVAKMNYKSRRARRKLDKMLQQQPSTGKVIKTMIQGNLLKIPSLLRNILAYPPIMMARFTQDVFSSVGDYMIATIGASTHITEKVMAKKWADKWYGKALSKFFDPRITTSNIIKQPFFFVGLGEGIIEGLAEVGMGISSKNYARNESSYILDSGRAFSHLITMAKGERKATLDSVLANTLEVLPPAWTAELMFRLLNLGDKPFRVASRRARLAEMGLVMMGAKGVDIMNMKDTAKIQAVKEWKTIKKIVRTEGAFLNELLKTEEGIKKLDEYADNLLLEGKEKDMFLENPYEYTKKVAEGHADVYTYQKARLGRGGLKGMAERYLEQKLNSQHPVTKKIQTLIKNISSVAMGVLVPYEMTPVNLVVEMGMLALPTVHLVRGLNYMAHGNRRGAMKSFGMYFVAKGIRAAVYGLIGLGIVRGESDEDETGTAEYHNKFIPEWVRPGDINKTALMRYALGGDPSPKEGDVWVSPYVFGSMGMLVSMHAKMYYDEDIQKHEQEVEFPVLGAVLGDAKRAYFIGKTMLEATFMRSAKSTLDALTGTTYEQDKFFANLYNVGVSSVYPNTFQDVKYLSQTDYMVKRMPKEFVKTEVYKDFKSLEEMPVNVNVWGDKVKIGEGYNKWNYAFFKVAYPHKQGGDVALTKLYNWYDEAKEEIGYKEVKAALPTSVSGSLNVKLRKEDGEDENVSVKLRSVWDDYAMMVGNNRYNLMSEYILNGSFDNDTHEERVEMLSGIYKTGKAFAKEEFLNKYLDDIILHIKEQDLAEGEINIINTPAVKKKKSRRISLPKLPSPPKPPRI
jgi:hypothetical protein